MRKEDFAEIFGDISEAHILEARAEHRTERRAKKPVWMKWGVVAACLCLIAAGVWHSNTNPPELPAVGGKPVSEADEAIWMSADEVLKSAEADTKMGAAVPMLVTYQGTIYSLAGEALSENSQYALLEDEVTLRRNFSYPTYQVRGISDNVAIVLNGRLEIYQKLFEITAVIEGTPYRIAYPFGLGIEYSYGEMIQETEDFTVYQSINAQNGEVMESEYVINILPLLKRELPNFFDGDENYGDAWWVAVPSADD